MSSFGKQRLADFYVDPKYVNINHGSYGYSPKSVIQYRRSIEEDAEFNTEKWFRRESEMYINEMRGYIASKINCPSKNVFIIQNATDGINCIAKSMKWSQGDVILLPNIAYASIRKTITVVK
jgi:selenocysteine lyase/cysteine desulfurase